MKYFCLSFDIEEFDVPLEFNKSISEENMFGISHKGTKRIISLLDNRRLKATFFTTARFAMKYPSLIKRISEKHEVALHGYKHDSNYKTMSDSEAYEELLKAKEEIEKIISKKIYGFRAPRMMSPSLKVLKRLGLKYNASLHPTYVPGRYNHFFKPRKIFEKDDVTVIPTSVVPLVRMPMTWLWFRNLGLNYSKV
ncbi:MAG: polysaccharide deacetylase family protein, partial [Nanoarchaeota archaeon]|nr:polysaccharide deacetylase family protein [Nanoarchaeota archaeon]